jgi:hypothetical protein
VHHPGDNVNPNPCSSGVKALNSVISVKRIEKEESSLSVVHWATDSVQEKEDYDACWGKNSCGKRLTGSHHLFEVKLIYQTLGEENSIVVNHH